MKAENVFVNLAQVAQTAGVSVGEAIARFRLGQIKPDAFLLATKARPIRPLFKNSRLPEIIAGITSAKS